MNLKEKILLDDYFYDIKMFFDNLLTIENDIYNILHSDDKNDIYDENDIEFKMLGIDKDFVNFGNGYNNYKEEIERKDLFYLLIQYENILNKIFIFFSNGIDNIRVKKIDSIKKFYSIKIDNLNLENITFKNKEELILFIDNPYGLLYNSFVYYFEVFMNYFIEFDNAKDDLYYKSSIVANGLPINFGDIENLKLWEDAIDIKDFTIKNFIAIKEGNITNISIKHLLAFKNTNYTLKGLIK